ncbi:hypothetical protein VTI74DRAFT_263 [Chaetomium olivicolor]
MIHVASRSPANLQGGVIPTAVLFGVAPRHMVRFRSLAKAAITLLPCIGPCCSVCPMEHLLIWKNLRPILAAHQPLCPQHHVHVGSADPRPQQIGPTCNQTSSILGGVALPCAEGNRYSLRDCIQAAVKSGAKLTVSMASLANKVDGGKQELQKLNSADSTERPEINFNHVAAGREYGMGR